MQGFEPATRTLRRIVLQTFEIDMRHDQANTQNRLMPKKLSLALTVLLLAFSSLAQAQTLKTLVHQPPNGALFEFPLTDGSVMCQANASSDWWKLTPDINGSYLNGTWSQLALCPAGYAPDDLRFLCPGRWPGGNYRWRI